MIRNIVGVRKPTEACGEGKDTQKGLATLEPAAVVVRLLNKLKG